MIATSPVRAISISPWGRIIRSKESILSCVPVTSIVSERRETSTTVTEPAPHFAAATPSKGKGVQLSWTVPADGGSPITEYRVLRWSDGVTARNRIQAYDSTFGVQATDRLSLHRETASKMTTLDVRSQRLRRESVGCWGGSAL